MDTNYLLMSLLLGTIGMGLAGYGKRSGKYIHLGAGLALMVFPYFIPNLLLMSVVGLVLTGAPFLIRS